MHPEDNCTEKFEDESKFIEIPELVICIVMAHR